MSVIVQWMDQFDEFIDSMADEKTTSWPLMVSASRMIVVCLFYIFMVTLIGPKLMENRKPYNFKRIILVYNTFQVIACTILFTWVSHSNPTLICIPPAYITSTMNSTTSRICWWTTLLKLAEFMETFFFVLRKKQNQVSGLHVYHHTSTLVIMWGSTKLFPNPVVLLPVMINSFVHMLMYTYYLLSATGPSVQNRITGWKKYITITQMVNL
nr:elongation-very long chain-fatty acids-protein-4 [Kerria lacca]